VAEPTVEESKRAQTNSAGAKQREALFIVVVVVVASCALAVKVGLRCGSL
jgi:hypothetical protein